MREMSRNQKIRLHDLDRHDLAILDILQRDNTTPQRTIGDLVNLSAAAVQRRISRLQAGGVIAGNAAILNPAAVGHPIIVLVEVQIENERIDLLEATKAAFASAPEVQQCYYVTGETDFILVITIPTMQEYEALTKRLFFKDKNIKHFRSHVVMDRVKASMAVSLPDSRRDQGSP